MYAIIKYKDAENVERQSSIRVSNETEDQAVEKFIRIHNSNADHKITKSDITSVKFQKSAICFDVLKELKEQLFDASPEVKAAFNQVVKYFSNSSIVRSGTLYTVYHQHHPSLGFIYGLADSDSEFAQNLPDESVDGDDLSFNAAQVLKAKLELRDKDKLGK